MENGRDLIMIKRKLESDQYNSIEALEADFDMMIRNCYTFNGTESQISYSARELSDKFKTGMKRIKSGMSFRRRAACFAPVRPSLSRLTPSEATDAQRQMKRGNSSSSGGANKKQRI